MALTSTVKTDLYRFFAVAFDAAPGVTYMNQLAEAVNSGMTIPQIVEVFTTKTQFTSVYPTFFTNEQFATKLVNTVVGDSATSAAKAEAAADIVAALALGGEWTRGKVIYTIFNNLANKAADDATWGNTSKQMANQVAYAQYYTEEMLSDSTDMATLRAVISNVTQSSSTDAAVIAAALTPAAAAQTFTLTTSANTFTGTAGNDNFDGALNSNASQTLASNDFLNGGNGTDTLNATLTGAAAQTVRPTLTSIETIDITSSQTGGTVGTLDLGSSTGYTSVNNQSSTGNLAFSQLSAATVAVGVTSASGTTTVNFVDAALSGTADSLNLTLNGATGGITITDQGGSNALETLAITSTGTASNLGAGGLTTGASAGTGVGTTKITVTGGADLNLGTVALATQILTVDASAATGALTAITGASTSGQTVTGGSGNDSFTLAGTQNDVLNGGAGDDTFIMVNTNLTVNDTIGGGDGTSDRLVLSGAADYAVADATFANVTGVERLVGATVAQGNTATVDLTVTASTFMKAAGITRFTDAATGDSAYNLTVAAAYNGTAVTYDFADVADTADFTASAASTTAVMTFQGDADGLTANDVLTGGTSSGDTLILSSAGTTGTIANAGLNGIETINITATNGSVTLISADTQITDAATTVLTINASTASSATTVTLGSIAHGMVYTGNSSVDSVTSGSGNDNITLGAGNDVYVVASANFTSADTVAGGDGNTDTITISDAATVIDSDFTNVTGVEYLSQGLLNATTTATLGSLANAAGIVRVIGNGTGNTSVTLETGFTNALRVALATGADTVNAAAAASVVTVSVTETGLTAGDALTGGTSSADALLITPDADAGLTAAELANVSGFEVITVASDAAALSIALADVNTASAATMTVNAAAMISGANALTLDASLETNGKISVTGGAGADAITLTANGADYVDGGVGIDTITVTSAGFTSTDSIVGGDGNDIITMSDAATVVDADFTNVTSVMTLTSTGTGSANTLTATLGALALAAGVTSVVGGTGVDTVTVGSGYTGTVRVTPTSGSDVISAAASGATLQVATSLDNIDAGDIWTGGTGASDSLIVTTGTATAATMANITAFETITTSGDAGAFVITTADANVATGVAMTVNAASLVTTNALTFNGSAETNGRFSVTGGNAGDAITGGSGADTINGGAGDDVIDGGAGADSMVGGLGNDTIVIGSATDAADGGTGTNDTLTVSSIGSGTFVINLSNTADQLTTYNGSANDTVQQGFESANLSAVNGAVTATAATGGSTITTGSAADTLTDGAGADVLTGGAGNDTITSSAGVDQLNGGLNNDRYIVTLNSVGVFDDTITDTGGTDTVVILGSAPSSSVRATIDLTAAAFGTNVIESLDVTGLSVAGATVTTSTGGTTVFGSDFADSITGGAGVDNISGGDGADTITGGAAADVLTGGNGADDFVQTVLAAGGVTVDTISDLSLAQADQVGNFGLVDLANVATLTTVRDATTDVTVGAVTTAVANIGAALDLGGVTAGVNLLLTTLNYADAAAVQVAIRANALAGSATTAAEGFLIAWDNGVSTTIGIVDYDAIEADGDATDAATVTAILTLTGITDNTTLTTASGVWLNFVA